MPAYLDAQAKALAQAMGISDPPAVDPIRLISLDEWAPTLIDCLTQAGFDVGLTDDGEGIAYPPIEDPVLAAELTKASYICQVEYPVAQKYTQPLSDKQLRALYTYRASELVECLDREGYTPSDSAPSESVFLESRGAWSPYESVQIPSNDLGRISRLCPQVPEDLYE